MATLAQDQPAPPSSITAEIMFTNIEEKFTRKAAAAVQALGIVEEIATKHWSLLLHYTNGMTRVIDGAATSGKLRCYTSWRATKTLDEEPRSSMHLGEQRGLTDVPIEEALRSKQIVEEKPYILASNSCQTMVIRLLRLMAIPAPHALVTAQQELARLAEQISMVSGIVSGITSSVWSSGLL